MNDLIGMFVLRTAERGNTNERVRFRAVLDAFCRSRER
jgi:hypothetical protein